MVLPYVYVLTHRITGQRYIGSRWANKVPSGDDLGKVYFTSSKHIKPVFDQFEPVIIAEFYDRQSAFDFEQSLIRDNWGQDILNRAYCRVTDNTIKFVGSKSDEHKRKISESSKGKSRNRGVLNSRYGNGYKIAGANNPKSRSWRILNIKTNKEYFTDDLVRFCKEMDVPYSTIATATTFKSTRTWYSERINKG